MKTKGCFRLFKGRFILEYLFPVYGLLCYFTPGLDTRRRIITELREMFRQSITEHSNTLDTNQPRSVQAHTNISHI